MDIRIKAGLQVAGFFVAAAVGAILTNVGLRYLVATFGIDEISRAFITACIVGLVVFFGGIMYDLRLYQLKCSEKYKNK